MATLPSAKATSDDSGAGVGLAGDYICILSCSPLGTANDIQIFNAVQDDLDRFGDCDGVDAASHIVEITRKPYMRGKLATATEGALGPIDTRGVSGTSVVSFSGTPTDEEDIVVKVVNGGTVGVNGITIKTSRDGGDTWGGTIRLGTATAYAIPRTGLTVAFGAGTLVAGDVAKAKGFGPTFDGAGLTAMFTALFAHPQKPRALLLCGEAAAGSDIDAIITEIEAFESARGRHTVVIHSLRDRYTDAVTRGVADIDFDAADTITRSAGSFVADGWKVGMVVTISGTANNNGTGHVVSAVTASVLTVGAAPGLATEANVATAVLVGSEPLATWRSAIASIVSATPATSKVSEKVVVTGGRARRRSRLNGAKKRRPASWPFACAMMAHDIHISPAKVENGALGWTIHGDDNQLREHDERVHGGLLDARIASLTTFDEKPGIFVSLPVTLAEEGRPFSRLPIVLVGQLGCTVAKRATTEKLNGNYILSPTTGRLLESEARRIELYVQTQINNALLNAAMPEGKRASGAVFTLGRTADLRVPGAIVTWELDLTGLGYIEHFEGRVRVGGAS